MSSQALLQIRELKKLQEEKMLDAKASYTILENCMNFLQMNDMPELAMVKLEIKRTMKDLEDVIENGQ